METVKFICEFFFGNLWHWLGLLVIVAVICGSRLVEPGPKKDKNDNVL